MRQVGVWAGAALACALLVVPAGATAGGGGFRAYPSCGAKGAHPDAFCFEGDHPTAVLRAFGQARVPYKLCVRKKGQRKRCHDRRTRGAGSPSRTRFDIDGSGKYKLVWFAKGRAVDRDALVIRERTVFSVGDSLGEGTRPYLPGALRGWRVEQSVSISRHAPEGVSILRNRGGLPSVIVFALGTNDDPGAVTTFRNAIDGAISIAGRTRCVVIPNIVRPPVGGNTYAGYNNAIAEASRKHRNVRVVDWAGLVARNRGWLAGDGVHVNGTGYAARARLIANQVERC